MHAICLVALLNDVASCRMTDARPSIAQLQTVTLSKLVVEELEEANDVRIVALWLAPTGSAVRHGCCLGCVAICDVVVVVTRFVNVRSCARSTVSPRRP